MSQTTGNYQLAEQHGLAAVDANPDDVWATHAVTYVYEMQGRMTADVDLPACRAVVAYIEDHADAVAERLPIRRILARFGGSHAQRDALQRTLVASALRAGQLDLACALLNERIGVRENSVWSWRRRAQLSRTAGDSPDADRSDGRASSHASSFAAEA